MVRDIASIDKNRVTVRGKILFRPMDDEDSTETGDTQGLQEQLALLGLSDGDELNFPTNGCLRQA